MGVVKPSSTEDGIVFILGLRCGDAKKGSRNRSRSSLLLELGSVALLALLAALVPLRRARFTLLAVSADFGLSSSLALGRNSIRDGRAREGRHAADRLSIDFAGGSGLGRRIARRFVGIEFYSAVEAGDGLVEAGCLLVVICFLLANPLSELRAHSPLRLAIFALCAEILREGVTGKMIRRLQDECSS